MKKSELRQIYLSKQKAISQQYRLANSEAIADLFFVTFDLREIRFLHSFIPIIKFNEIDTRLIVERVWRDYPHVQIVVPRVDLETNEMKGLKFDPNTELVRSAWEIEEPIHDEVVADREINMVLTPGLCFDRGGHRVGYGKGFYDRFLKNCRADCVKIGLGHFDLVDSIEDVHEGDVRLDAVVTPDAVFDTGQNREL
jgi:5-formyltetrahydrofolate cyclo-ligase